MNASAKKTGTTRQFDFIGKRRVFGAISAVAVLAALVLLVYPGPNYGIDFAGGTNILVKVSSDVGDDELRDVMEDAGYKDASVQGFGTETDGSSQYLIRTEAISTIDDASVDAIRQSLTAAYSPELEVRFDKTSGDRFYVTLPASAYSVSETAGEEVGLNEYAAQAEQQAQTLAERIAAANADVGDPKVEIYGNTSDRRFVVKVETLQSAVQSQLSDALGDRFHEIERIESVGPRVGEQLRNDSIKAVLIALLMILLYIGIRFDVQYAPGAVIALFHDVLITLGIFVIIRQEISLPIVAALLTIVGYSLNDTIVNFDRMRENTQLTGGREKIEQLVNRSLNECLSRTLLTSITTFIALLAIYFLGGGLIKDFALAMILGVLIGTYSSIFIASPIMIWTKKELDKRDRRADRTSKRGASKAKASS